MRRISNWEVDKLMKKTNRFLLGNRRMIVKLGGKKKK